MPNRSRTLSGCLWLYQVNKQQALQHSCRRSDLLGKVQSPIKDHDQELGIYQELYDTDPRTDAAPTPAVSLAKLESYR